MSTNIRIRGRLVQLLALYLPAFTLPAAIAAAQIRPEINVLTTQMSNNHSLVLRFDARLELAGSTDITPVWLPGSLDITSQIAIDEQGTHWLCCDALNKTLLVRIDRNGAILPSTVLGENPLSVLVTADDRLFATTRIPFTSPGKFYALNTAGAILWSTWKPVTQYIEASPDVSAMTPSGELWLGGQTQLCGACTYRALLTRVDTSTGALVQSLLVPQMTISDVVADIAARPDGTITAVVSGPTLLQLSSAGILAQHPVLAGYNGVTTQMRADAAGEVWLLQPLDQSVWMLGSHILRFDPTTGAMTADLDAGGLIYGFALDATGESAYLITENNYPISFERRLTRLNLVTGARSSILLDPPYWNSKIPFGDPTGFVYANVTNQAGDNDGDGATNREETSAGSNPYDPESRPNGPKVYLSFLPSTNAIRLKYVDPDGLLDPAGGLDLATLSLTAQGYGEILPLLWSFISSVAVDPNGREATIEFGLLPIPSGTKVRLEATARDKTGAIGFDWQATPPGEL